MSSLSETGSHHDDLDDDAEGTSGVTFEYNKTLFAKYGLRGPQVLWTIL